MCIFFLVDNGPTRCFCEITAKIASSSVSLDLVTGRLSMNIDANGESESQDEDKRTQDGVLGDRKTSFQGSDLKVDAAMGDGKEGVANVLQGPGFPQVQQQQSQGTVVCWERFLHVRTIRVLLVESDDSTRHVVTALLRNCNYEGRYF